MLIRGAEDGDWPAIHPFFRAIVAAGRSYAYPEDLPPEQARALWMESPPGRTVVAMDGSTVLGSAKMGPNRPGRGSHVATASFMVDPAHSGRGVGRALGEHVIDWARLAGYRSIQFNAVVETNEVAVRLWRSLGFGVLATVPESFDHPEFGLVGLHVMFLDLAGSSRRVGAQAVSIRTARLVLRRFRPTDAPALARYRSAPEVARFQSWEAPVTAGAAAELVESYVRGDLHRPGWFQYAITVDDRLIGDLGVRREENLEQAEIGITLDPAHHHRGYATEALTAVVAHLFDERGLHKVSAECDARNAPSATLLRRVGFVEEGRRRAHTWIKGEWTDDLLFGLLATDPPRSS